MASLDTPSRTLASASLPSRQASWDPWADAPRSPLTALLQPARQGWSAWFILVLLCGILFFYGLNLGELYRTESLRAIIGAEFLRSGNWTVPTLYGQPLLTKPPGMYAAIAAVSWPWGYVTEWTARLPSALAATAVVFLVYWYVGRQLGRLGGLVAAAITPCTYLWIDKASAAEIDMLQVAWIAAALLFFFRAAEDAEAVNERTDEPVKNATSVRSSFFAGSFPWWLAALLCMAGGVLTKWTAPVFCYATMIPFLLWRRQFHLLFSLQHLLSAFIAAAICLAWVAAVIQQVGWNTFYQTVAMEALPRLSHRHNLSEHQLLETLVHPFKILLVNLPWSGFALLTLLPGFSGLWDARGWRLLQAFHCWTWPNLLVWTLLPDHATRYSFPLFPGITGLAALVWLACLTGRLPAKLGPWHVGLALLAMTVFGFGAMTGTTVAFWLLPSAAWWLLLLVFVMAGWCVCESFRAWRAGRPGGLLLSMILSWVVLKFAYLHLYIPVRDGELPLRQVELSLFGTDVRIEHREPRAPRAKGRMLADMVPAGQPLYIVQVKDEGIMFYYGRPVIRLSGWRGLPLGRDPVYCVVVPAEWRQLQRRGDCQPIRSLKDQQGEPILLVCITRSDPPILQAARP